MILHQFLEESVLFIRQQIIETDELDKYLRTLGEKIILTGDGAEDFFSKYEYESYTLSPVHLRLQSAAGIILASLDKPHQTDDDLQASYLQIVKAEKDLIKAQRG